ncbi:MAG: HPF/RaiA family ribosome-associated protein [Bryobacteraceae bacterium]
MKPNGNLLTIESLTEFASLSQPPCLSLCQPTHRRFPENQQDPIRFRNLVRELEASLRQKYPAVETQLLLKPFEDLAHNADFWNDTLDGLAVLGGKALFRAFRLQRPVAELAVVADSFHTTPLRRFLQFVGRYQILGLSLRQIQLFEGNRDALDLIDPAPGVPRTIPDALGGEVGESHLTVASYGGAGHGTTPMRHGDGGRQDLAEADTERFFRAVDRAITEHHSRPSGLPLILAALPEHHHLFHQVSHNPSLMAKGIAMNPDTVPIDELRERAWKVVEPRYQAEAATLAAEFATAKSKSRGSDDLAEVAQAVATGRVVTLLIESDRLIGGRLDGATARVELSRMSDPRVDDLLDDLGELTMKSGGRAWSFQPGRCRGRRDLRPSTGTDKLQRRMEHRMHIQINTDHNIEGREALATYVREVVENALNLVSGHITRMVVHLSDENSDKSGPNDKRCVMEARLEGCQPIVITHQASTINDAVCDAADKLARLIESTLERHRELEGHRTDSPVSGARVP